MTSKTINLAHNDKQMPRGQKKTSLRNVKDENVNGSSQKQQESLLFGEGRTSENENVKNARLRFQLELDRVRLHKTGVYTDNPQSRNRSQLPQEISHKQTQTKETHIDSMGANDRLRTGRFICLQRFLNQCDEAKQIDYMRMLLQLSPAELSRHAGELERRTTMLSREEEKEMQRVEALNILGKSGPDIQSTQ